MADTYYKFTKEECETCNILRKLEDSTINMIDSYAKNYMCSIAECESPIERMLALKMYEMNLRNFYYFDKKIDVVDIENQGTIEIKNKSYRVDFSILVWYSDKKDHKCFIVECDGHDFHEKTKEQVAKNNKKTRDLTSAGYEVIHFSGSEIYNNCDNCVEEIIEIIKKHAE